MISGIKSWASDFLVCWYFRVKFPLPLLKHASTFSFPVNPKPKPRELFLVAFQFHYKTSKLIFWLPERRHCRKDFLISAKTLPKPLLDNFIVNSSRDVGRFLEKGLYATIWNRNTRFQYIREEACQNYETTLRSCRVSIRSYRNS